MDERLKEHILRFLFGVGVVCIFLLFLYITTKNPFPIIFPFAGFIFCIGAVWMIFSDIFEYFNTSREMRATRKEEADDAPTN